MCFVQEIIDYKQAYSLGVESVDKLPHHDIQSVSILLLLNVETWKGIWASTGYETNMNFDQSSYLFHCLSMHKQPR
jgi:hypothetical protein